MSDPKKMKIICHFCCMPADRWVRFESNRGPVSPACPAHSDEGEVVPFIQGCAEYLAYKTLTS